MMVSVQLCATHVDLMAEEVGYFSAKHPKVTACHPQKGAAAPSMSFPTISAGVGKAHSSIFSSGCPPPSLASHLYCRSVLSPMAVSSTVNAPGHL